MRDPHRLPGGIPAVSIDIELGVGADDLAGQGHPGEVTALIAAPRLPDLDLHPGDLLPLDPAGQLLAGLVLVIAGETAAAVGRDVLAHPPEQVRGRQAEQPGLEIPQRDVNGGDGHRRDTWPADVAHGPRHGLGGARDVERAASQHRPGQHGRGGPSRVGPADPLLARRPGGHQDHGRLVPAQSSVGLGRICRDDIDRCFDVVEHGSVSGRRALTRG
jgi:hypothetical protein